MVAGRRFIMSRTQITAVLISEDSDKPMERVKFDRGDIKTMQGYVGGNFDVIDGERPDCSFWFGDESKLKEGWQINRRGTYLLWVHNSAYWRQDVIAGDCLVTGAPDRGGNTTSVPDELVKLLFDTQSFRVELQFNQEEEWKETPDRFNDWETAYRFGIQLRGQVPEMSEARILPA
jgi:hypothetical protein